MYKCSKCSKEFKYQSEKQRHEESHSPKFGCEKCDKKFSFHSALKRHEKQHQRTGVVECSQCNRQFLDETLLKRHIKYAHGDTFKCEICESQFHSEVALRVHSKSHKSQSERRYKCSHKGCDKAFNFKHHLKHHELTHDNVKQYYCYVCGKGFIQLHHRNTHLKIHEPENGIPCIMVNCHKKFSSAYAMKRHLTSHNKTLCSTCGETVLLSQYEKHNEKCHSFDSNPLELDDIKPPAKIIENQQKTSCCENKQNELNVTVDKIKLPEILIKSNKISINDVISNCKTSLGTCIVSGSSDDNENCLCSQMTNSNVEIDNMDTSLAEINDIIKEDSLRINEDSSKLHIKLATVNDCCSGCECADICTLALKTTTDKYAWPFKYEEPEVKYSLNGALKIIDTCDIDFENNEKYLYLDKDNKTSASMEISPEKDFVPLNSCKAVLGNCIASEDGSVGEGCLCVKMKVESQIDAQEIEEITPIATEKNLDTLL